MSQIMVYPNSFTEELDPTAMRSYGKATPRYNKCPFTFSAISD
jgi:hypothetical protein